jgi:O-antigen ligase
MEYKDWKLWIGSLPWYLKWFVILVLIRPIVDNFYYLKNISPVLSPLYFVGIATPILCVVALINYRKKDYSIFDLLYGIWGILMLVSLFFMFLYDPLSKTFLEYFLKLTMPIYLFFFLRLLIRSRNDLDGILQTFIYSSLFVIAIFLFEIFINPVKVLKTRGLERIQGSYGDVMNYAIYMSLGFLIMCYFYLRNKNTKSIIKMNRNLIITIALSLACLFKISHTASYGVFLVILLLFIVYNLKTNKTTGIILIVTIGSLGYFFGASTIEEKIAPLIQTDIAVYEGKKENERLLHGRVGRWKQMIEEYSEFSVPAQLFGMPLKIMNTYPYVGTGSHNDFVRILFYTGFFGLITYLAILLNIFRRMRFLASNETFLTIGTFMILFMYSVSTCPTLYAPMLYIIYSVICFISLPKSFTNTLENE